MRSWSFLRWKYFRRFFFFSFWDVNKCLKILRNRSFPFFLSFSSHVLLLNVFFRFFFFGLNCEEDFYFVYFLFKSFLFFYSFPFAKNVMENWLIYDQGKIFISTWLCLLHTVLCLLTERLKIRFWWIYETS